MDSTNRDVNAEVGEKDMSDEAVVQLSTNEKSKRHRNRGKGKKKGKESENLNSGSVDGGSNIVNDYNNLQDIKDTQNRDGENTIKNSLSKNARRKGKHRNSQRPQDSSKICNSGLTDSTLLNNMAFPLEINASSCYNENMVYLQQHFAANISIKPQNSKNRASNQKSISTSTAANVKQPSNMEQETLFPTYWTENMIKISKENNSLIEGVLRINKKNYQEAYITHPDGDQDVIIEKIIARNRALEGDTVLVKINGPKKWTAEGQRTGFVVSILIKNHPRTCIGSFNMQNIHEKCTYFLFIPRDCRMPRMRIPVADCPEFVYRQQSQNAEHTLYLAKITEWTNTKYAVGSVLKPIGKAGLIAVETEAILMENDLDSTPYDPEMDKFFPQTPFVIPEEEFSYRRDCRNMCIFTIDPETAKDLDDAVSCVELENGNFEVGVHISDVGYFLKPENDLDKAVAKKATTIYMVDRVYHMLPKSLCMMCSLLPGDDKLAFSVFWEMTKEGKLINQTIKRTIINSCTQLAYEHAQMMIENPEKDFNNDTAMPVVYNNYKPNDLCKIVNQLNRIATILKQNRFDNGALKIDNPKLSFKLNPSTYVPDSYSFENSSDSHSLIEEYMLLANVTIAQHLHKNYPKLAFLRMHPSPVSFLLKELQSSLAKFDININVGSAKEIQQSLTEFAQRCLNGRPESVMIVLNNMCSRTMTRARYFCAEEAKCEDDFWHYALHVPLYTHFTSPIRRYADIMVHRQLADSLGYRTVLRSAQESHEVAAQCNKNKYNAKKAFEMSSELFLRHYITMNSPLVERAVVCDVKDRSFDVLIISMAFTRRIYYKTLPDTVKYNVIVDPTNKKILTLELEWSNNQLDDLLNKKENNGTVPEEIKKQANTSIVNNHDKLKGKQRIKIFTEVLVKLIGKPDASSVDAFLLYPIQHE